jgi:pimeloyl-ACP methyl ester carboxylesterase
MQTHTGRADINGAGIYYEIAGDGPPLMFVHAGIADGRMWDEQFDFFAHDYTVVRPDLRGYGRTPMPPGPFAHHRDLAALLRHLDLPRAAWVGCSMGGAAILDLALEHPEMIAALVPVASGVSGFEYEGGRPAQWAALEEAYYRGDLLAASEYEVQIWVDGPRRGPGDVPAALRDKVRAMNLIPLAVPEDPGQEVALDPPAIGRLGEIAAPALVVVGSLDQPSILARCERIAEGIPGAETVTLPTAHLPNMELPEEFNAALRAFLRWALPGG